MADPEHVEVVKRGAAAIAEWRQENLGVVLELGGADLRRTDLSRANLRMANLIEADLGAANLLWANLSWAKLHRVNLSRVNLRMANLFEANLFGANLSGANLSGAELVGANLLWANLSGANLSAANLGEANLLWANLSDTNFSGARLFDTTFGQCDLSLVSGLETVRHEGPSSIGTDTLLLTYEGAGNRLTPELRGFFIKAGVPASLLDALPTIAGQIRYHTAFIGYGEPDRDFAERLYGDLLTEGVSCWMFSKDYIPGERTWNQIRRKRREAGKFIVLCSVGGLMQAGPKKEIEDQMDDDPAKIIPVSLDNRWRASGFEVRRAERDLKTDLLPLNYVDFSPGTDHPTAFEQLLRGLELKADAPAP